MIIGERKPIEEILEMTKDYRSIYVAGCGSCVTVCLAGGEKEVGVLSSVLRIAAKKEGRELKIIENTIERQCEKEWVGEMKKQVDEVDAVLSMACGVGVQLVAEMHPDKSVMPALNTSFLGYPDQHALFVENCRACGDCVLHLTGGVCPVARCAKQLMNGPCGGSQDGKCEINSDIKCAWQLIHDKLKAGDRMAWMTEVQPPKRWDLAGSGGPRKVVKEEEVIEK
jgi:ferredoxin